ncbi:MAG: HEPN domain-containing protein [Tepidisphaerales bacterium]
MTPTTREWVLKAEGDYDAVCILRRSRKPTRFDAICFHCQQCAEKYLKARLNEAGIPFSKTHDLGTLLALALPIEPLWAVMDVPLKRLTDYAVVSRYPGTTADRRAATDAFQAASRLREFARNSLGLKM